MTRVQTWTCVRPLALVSLAVVVLAVLINPAFAQDLSPVNTFFESVGNALTGTTGRAIGLVAVAGAGILFLTGRIPLMAALSVLLGLVILYGAATILSGIGTA